MDIKITAAGLSRWLESTANEDQKVRFSAFRVRNLTVNSRRDNETARQAFLAYVLRTSAYRAPHSGGLVGD